MPTYRDIDPLLLTTSRGWEASRGPGRDDRSSVRPGDIVAVSRLDGRPVTILVHRIDRENSTWFGEIQTDISVDGRVEIAAGSKVSFSPGKIAGIHR